MSTASAFPPDRPLRAVPNTDHIQRQKNLMGAFLATQDVLTRYASKGGAFIADLLMPLFEIPQSCSSKFPTLAG